MTARDLFACVLVTVVRACTFHASGGIGGGARAQTRAEARDRWRRADGGRFGVCVDGVWPGKTHIAIGQDQGCGATTSRRAGGVMGCRS